MKQLFLTLTLLLGIASVSAESRIPTRDEVGAAAMPAEIGEKSSHIRFAACDKVLEQHNR